MTEADLAGTEELANGNLDKPYEKWTFYVIKKKGEQKYAVITKDSTYTPPVWSLRPLASRGAGDLNWMEDMHWFASTGALLARLGTFSEDNKNIVALYLRTKELFT